MDSIILIILLSVPLAISQELFEKKRVCRNTHCLEKRVDFLEKEYEYMINSHFYLSNELSDKDAKIKDYQERLSEKEKMIKELERELKKSTERIKQMETRNQSQDSEAYRWPSGTYGLYKTTSGCPVVDARWENGSRIYDTQDNGLNLWSVGLPEHMSGHFGDDIRNDFCIKTTDDLTSNDQQWQSGSYCLLKKGNCPSGFSDGYLQWDDEDISNGNVNSGTMPDGEYGINTKIYYCCREDGLQSDPIHLPTGNHFYLSRKGGSCQSVNDMTVEEEWLQYDCENNGGGIISLSFGTTPDHDLLGSPPNLKIYFCYYHK